MAPIRGACVTVLQVQDAVASSSTKLWTRFSIWAGTIKVSLEAAEWIVAELEQAR